MGTTVDRALSIFQKGDDLKLSLVGVAAGREEAVVVSLPSSGPCYMLL